MNYVDGPEAAFYGEIDIQFEFASGREESVSTIQLDFAPRMGLTYVGADNAEHMPLCIHRAPFSTHGGGWSRFCSNISAARFRWLAPVQVQVNGIGSLQAYGRKIVDRLRNRFTPLGTRDTKRNSVERSARVRRKITAADCRRT